MEIEKKQKLFAEAMECFGVDKKLYLLYVYIKRQKEILSCLLYGYSRKLNGD